MGINDDMFHCPACGAMPGEPHVADPHSGKQCCFDAPQCRVCNGTGIVWSADPDGESVYESDCPEPVHNLSGVQDRHVDLDPNADEGEEPF